jgi:hypothetical protein
MAAWTWIHRRRKHESGRECQRHRGTADRHTTVLKRLPQDLQHVALEFRQLIQKQDAVMR